MVLSTKCWQPSLIGRIYLTCWRYIWRAMSFPKNESLPLDTAGGLKQGPRDRNWTPCCWATSIPNKQGRRGHAGLCAQQTRLGRKQVSFWLYAACCHSLFRNRDPCHIIGWCRNTRVIRDNSVASTFRSLIPKCGCQETAAQRGNSLWKLGLIRVCSWECWAWRCLPIELTDHLLTVVLPVRWGNWKWPWEFCG